MKKILICGGHLTPALAVIEKLQKEKNLEVVFFGRKFSTEGSSNFSAEYRVLAKANIKFYSIFTGRLQRKFTKYTLISLLKIPFGFLQTFLYLLMVRPKFIISFGGYLSFPVVFSGWLLGIDSVIHEQAAVPGLANRLNSLFAKKVFLTWSQTKKYFEDKKCKVIGNPVRKSIFETKSKSKDIDQLLKKTNDLIYVTGGNQGSHFLNGLVFDSLEKLKDFSILHQVGTANFKGDFDKATKIRKNNYQPKDYINPQDIGAILDKAFMVISRSGANTVWELASCAKPAILVPLPFSAHHEQEENAKILEKAGFVKVLRQKDLTPQTLIKNIEGLRKDYQKYENLAKSFQKSLPQDAARKIVDYVLRYT